MYKKDLAANHNHVTLWNVNKEIILVFFNKQCAIIVTSPRLERPVHDMNGAPSMWGSVLMAMAWATELFVPSLSTVFSVVVVPSEWLHRDLFSVTLLRAVPLNRSGDFQQFHWQHGLFEWKQESK